MNFNYQIFDSNFAAIHYLLYQNFLVVNVPHVWYAEKYSEE